MSSSAFTPTPTQVTLMVAVIESVIAEGNLKCNWHTVAKQTGLAHAKSACDQWGRLQRIIKASQTTSAGRVAGSVVASKPVTPKEIPKRKRLDEDGGIGEDDEDCNGGRVRKAADRGKNKLSSVAKEEEDDR